MVDVEERILASWLDDGGAMTSGQLGVSVAIRKQTG